MLPSLAPARRRLVLGLLAAGLVAALVAVAVAGHAALAGNRAAARPVAQDVAGPVLLLPGYGGSTSALASLAGRLRGEGRDVTVVSLPDRAEGDLGGEARTVAAAATAALARTRAASVDVVGYSAGGVVARLWVRQYGGAAIARRVVALGSPQHGTELAALGSLVAGQCPTACQQLVPGSAVLNALNAGTEVPRGPVFISIWTARDQVVLPPQSAVLAGGINVRLQDVCPASTVDHTGLPTDPLVIAMVTAELTGPAARPFGAPDCARLR